MKGPLARRPEQKNIVRSAWKRLFLALPLSVLVHLVVVLMMRPEYRDVSDFAIDFQVIEVTPGQPKRGTPTPEPEPESESKPEPEPRKAPEIASPTPIATKTPKLPKSTTPKTAKPTGVPGAADAGVGSGICMHDLFAYSESEPEWLLYISMASFRETVFQKELGRTFESFDLGRRLTRYMGMNPAEEVEAVFVASNDIFDWRSFRIVGSYDSGEEKLKGEMTKRLKDHPLFKWRKEDGGFVGSIPGEFEWRLIGSGRVFAINYAPPSKNSTTGPVMPIPDNPFEKDAGVMERQAAGAEDQTAAVIQKWPKQVPCIEVSDKKSKKREKKRAAVDIEYLSKSYLTPDDDGHFPVALLSTTDSRALGIGHRLGRRLGFSHAVFRGYFTDPVRIEGVLVFNGEEKGVQMLAKSWTADAKRFSRDPILMVTGVSHLLENLTIRSQGTSIHVSMTLTERQVLSTLLFLQLQGKALERQLKAKR